MLSLKITIMSVLAMAVHIHRIMQHSLAITATDDRNPSLVRKVDTGTILSFGAADGVSHIYIYI